MVAITHAAVPPSDALPGGNQRDLAREKANKKAAAANKGQRDDGLTVTQRKERDAQAMREKQQVRSRVL